MSVFVNLYLIPALALGAIYAMGAVGISMIFGILRFSHFAHGDIMTLGAYGALSAVWAFGLHPLAALPFGIALAVAAALVADRAFYRPLRKLPTIYPVIASFGVALMLRSAMQLVWGPQNQQFIDGVAAPLILFGWLRLSPLHAEAIALSLCCAIALHVFLTRSRAGRQHLPSRERPHRSAPSSPAPSPARSTRPGSEATAAKPVSDCTPPPVGDGRSEGSTTETLDDENPDTNQ